MRPKLVVVAILGLILSIALIFLEEPSGGLNPEDKKKLSSMLDTAAFSETAVELGAADGIVQASTVLRRMFVSSTPYY